MQRADTPVIFAVPGKGKATIEAFSQFLTEHNGQSNQIAEVVCDMSKAFIQGVKDNLPEAEITIDWFHVVQIFSRAVDTVRKQERKENAMPKGMRWAVLKTVIRDN